MELDRDKENETLPQNNAKEAPCIVNYELKAANYIL